MGIGNAPRGNPALLNATANADVAFWPKADMAVRASDVRFPGAERTSARVRRMSTNDGVDDARSGIGVP